MKDAAAEKAVTKKFLTTWKRLLSIEDWDITIKYKSLPEDELGNCSVVAAHKQASIEIDPKQHKNKELLLLTVRHELLHLVHANFNIYRNAVEGCLGSSTIAVADTIFETGSEDVVLKIENLLKRLNINIKGGHDV